MGRLIFFSLAICISLLLQLVTSSEDDPYDVEHPLEYHAGLPILTLRVPRSMQSIHILEDGESAPVSVKSNHKHAFVASPFIAQGDPNGIQFVPDAMTFEVDGPLTSAFSIRAAKPGAYTVGIRVQSDSPTAYRDMGHIKVEVLPKGRVALSPTLLEAQFVGTQSRRYTLTLPPGHDDLNVTPSLGEPGEAPAHPQTVSFEPRVLQFRGSLRSLSFIIHISVRHDLSQARPENVLEVEEEGLEGGEGRVLAAAYPVHFRVECPFVPVPPDTPPPPRVASSFVVNLGSDGGVDAPLEAPTAHLPPPPPPRAPPACDPRAYIFPPSSELVIRLPVAIDVPLEAFLPLGEHREMRVQLSRAEDLVLVLRGSSPLVTFNQTEIRFSKWGPSDAAFTVMVRAPSGSAREPRIHCSMGALCNFTINYYARAPDPPAGGKGVYLNRDAVRIRHVDALGAPVREPGALPYAIHDSPGLGDTHLQLFGRGVALRLPSNDSTAFVNATAVLEVAVPAAVLRVWKTLYTAAPAEGSEETLDRPCTLKVDIESTFLPADSPGSGSDTRAGASARPAGVEEEDSQEEGEDALGDPSALPPTEDPPSSRAVHIEPASLCFHPAGDPSPARTFAVTVSRPGLVSLTYRLRGPAATFFNAPSSSVLQVHYPLLDPSFDLTAELRLGGLHEEIRQVIRRAFLTRVLPRATARALGVGHVRGILLYGPPGCGKTSLARALGRLLGAADPHVINGPEIISKYLGDSEGKLRAIFDAAEARAEEGDPRVQLIIFDEIDAMFRARGKGQGHASDLVYDGVTNTLLSRLDGLSATPNILVVGTTNRKELLDPALLRPGRMDVQIELALPTEPDRQDILDVHLKRLRDAGRVAPDVDVALLAAWTESFTGAELEGLVKSATSHALERSLRNATAAIDQRVASDMLAQSSLGDPSASPSESSFGVAWGDPAAVPPSAPSSILSGAPFVLQVTLADFDAALMEVEPSHRDADELLSRMCPRRLVRWSPSIDRVLGLLRSSIARVRGLPEGYASLLASNCTNVQVPGLSLTAPDRAMSVRLKREILRLKHEGKWRKSDHQRHAAGRRGASTLTADPPPSDSISDLPGPSELYDGHVLKVLVHGRAGSGKSALVSFCASEASSFFDYVEVIAPSDPSDHSNVSPIERLRRGIDAARKAPFSLLVLDDLDAFTEFFEGVQPHGGRQRFLSQPHVAHLRQTLRQLTSRNRLIILATASMNFAAAFPGVVETFDLVTEAPTMTRKEHVERVLQEIAAPNLLPLNDTKSVAAMARALLSELPLSVRRVRSVLEVLHASQRTEASEQYVLDLLGLGGGGGDGRRGKVARAADVTVSSANPSRAVQKRKAAEDATILSSLERRTRDAARLTRMVEGPGAEYTHDGESDSDLEMFGSAGVEDSHSTSSGGAGHGPGAKNRTSYKFW